MDQTQRTGQQLILGKILLERGVLSADQLKEALSERARRVASGGGESGAGSLGDILVEKGFLTREELDKLAAEFRMEPAAAAPPPQPAVFELPPAAAPSPPPPPAAGQLGKYQLLRELGRGGMGVVHEAMDVQLNRKVALKLMLPNAAADPKELAVEEERFVREAQLCAKLKHPNIVTVYETGVLEGRQFLAMELVEGKPLNEWRMETQTSLREQVEVLRDVTLAVHYAHEQGILHRDLKPRNILIGAGNHPFVTDFGLAKTLGKNVSNSITGQGMVVGTPAYMSPEQAQGLEKIDWRTDIYSLGVILYEILTNTTPFTGDSPIEILMKVVKDPVKPPSHVVPPERAMALDRTIENICLKALAKQDRDRYITAKAMADDLTKWLQGEEVKIALPKAKRKVSAIPIATAVFVVLVLGGGAFLWMGRVPSVREELEKARQSMAQQNHMDAMSWYIRALAKDPENAEAKEGEKAAKAALDRRQKETSDELKAAREKADREAQQATALAAEKSRQVEAAASEEEKSRLAAEREALLAKAREKTAVVTRVEDKLREASKGVLLTGAAAARNPEDPWRQALSLLPLVSLPRDAVWGGWSAQDGGVTSDRLSRTRLAFAFKPPEEYDLRVEFVRQSGTDAVRLYLSAAGRPFAWVLGAGANTVFGLETIGGRRAHENVTTFRSTRCLENKRSYVTTVQVRKDGVRAFLDGTPLVHWSGDVTELGLDPETHPSAFALGVGSDESIVLFRRVELLEVAGKGAALPAGAVSELKAAAVDPARLKPGLAGEYFYGTEFEVPGLRRIDSTLTFEWKSGPAWKAGPEEAFSARWRGYLQAPRSSKYLFSAAADDGVRVVIGGVQVLCGGGYSGQAPPEAEVALERGYHEILVEFFEKSFQASLVLSWAEGALQKTAPIPPRFLFHDPARHGDSAEAPAAEVPALLGGHTHGITSLDWSRDGKILASSSQDRRVKLWSLESRKEAGLLSGHAAGVMAVAFSPDGKRVASGGYDRKVRIWDPAKGTEVHALEGHTNFVKSLSFSRSGALLASGAHDGSIRLWNPVEGEQVRLLGGHEGGVTCVAFSADGTRLASSSVDQTVRIWDPVTGKETGRLAGHADWVEAVAWTPDGKELVSASWDSTVRVWDASTGRELRVLRPHRSEVMGLAVSPDGTRLATCGNDAIARILDLATGRELQVLPGHAGPVLAVAYTPDGRTLASAGDDGTIRIWSLKAR